MTRSMVCGALCVCRVAKTRWPVSAAVRAVEIVSRSRISPTRITSGSWRRAAFRARAKDCGVGADLALVDDALLVAVEELDRVLDGHDVLFARLVDRVDHGRQRGGLARARRARDEHHAARLLGEVVHGGRQPEVVDGDDVGGDQAEGGADGRALEVGVDAEARVAGDRVGEVDLPVGLEPLALVVGEDRVDDLARVGRRQARIALHAHEAAADADHRRSAGGDVQVGGAARHDVHEQVGEVEVHRPADRTFGHAP